MTSLTLQHLPEDTFLSILEYLNYEDLFYKEKSIISRLIHNMTKRSLENAKINNQIGNKFLSLYWGKKELGNIPIILYCPNKTGRSLRNRFFDIFDTKKPHQKLFISNIFTNKLSFMIKPMEDQLLFVEFLEHKLRYNVYSRPPQKLRQQLSFRARR